MKFILQPALTLCQNCRTFPSPSLGSGSNTKCNKDPTGLGLTISHQLREVLKDSVQQLALLCPALRHPDQSGFLSKSLLLIITMFYYRYFQLEYFCSIFYLQTCPGSIQPVCLPKDISQIGLHKVQIIVLFCSGQNNIRPTKTREGKIKKSKDRNTFPTQFCCSIAPWMVIFYGEISPDSL